MHYDASGTLIGHMGADLFAFPHGIHVDSEGNVWVTDPLPPDGRGAGGNVGQQVTKLSPTGEILLQIGTRKIAGSGTNQFSSPSDVVVGRNGDIFVADGHVNNRVVKFSKDGRFIKAWGKKGTGPGEFSVPHAIAIDSRGRVFVADRGNKRLQIFDQDGRYLEEWTQFGRPSGLLITADDTIYVADVQDKPGISFGSARDGVVRGTIDGTLPESIARDRDGSVYAGETTTGHVLRKFIKR